jgi:hypothetical protein
MTDDDQYKGPRDPSSFSFDYPDATEETIARGIRGAAERRRARQESRDEYWQGGGALGAELRTAAGLNRAAALRGPVSIDGVDHWWAVCVCRWCSVRLKDPELALREYDAHPCSIPVEDDAPMRAQRALNDFRLVERADGSYGIAKRPASILIPALAQERTAADEQALAGVQEGRDTTPATKQTEDDAVERFALLELK